MNSKAWYPELHLEPENMKTEPAVWFLSLAAEMRVCRDRAVVTWNFFGAGVGLMLFWISPAVRMHLLRNLAASFSEFIIR